MLIGQQGILTDYEFKTKQSCISILSVPEKPNSAFYLEELL